MTDEVYWAEWERLVKHADDVRAGWETAAVHWADEKLRQHRADEGLLAEVQRFANDCQRLHQATAAARGAADGYAHIISWVLIRDELEAFQTELHALFVRLIEGR